MSIFEPSTTPEESPEVTGQEETGAEEQQATEGQDKQETTAPEGQESAEESPSEESEQGEETQDYVPATTYNELRGAFTKKSQEAAELRRQLEQTQGQQRPPETGQGQQPPRPPQNMEEFNQALKQYQDQLKEAGWDEVTIRAISSAETANFKLYLREQAEAREEQLAAGIRINNYIADMAKDIPDLATPEGVQILVYKVMEIAPEAAANPSQRLLKLAAQEIWGDGKAELFQKGKAKGKQEALESIKAKQGVTTVATKKPQEQPKSIEDQIADSIVGAGRRGGMFG